VIPVAYQRETDDWRGFTLTNQGSAYAGSWSYQITARGSRPIGTWLSAVTLNSRKGIDIQGLAAGRYWVWFRIEGQSPYAPILDPVDLFIS
jgi:hypothetical protein